MAAKQHIAGPLVDQVQRCLRCDEILADYRQTGLADVPKGPPLTSVLGWECGKAVYELETGDWSAYVPPPPAGYASCLSKMKEPMA